MELSFNKDQVFHLYPRDEEAVIPFDPPEGVSVIKDSIIKFTPSVDMEELREYLKDTKITSIAAQETPNHLDVMIEYIKPLLESIWITVHVSEYTGPEIAKLNVNKLVVGWCHDPQKLKNVLEHFHPSRLSIHCSIWRVDFPDSYYESVDHISLTRPGTWTLEKLSKFVNLTSLYFDGWFGPYQEFIPSTVRNLIFDEWDGIPSLIPIFYENGIRSIHIRQECLWINEEDFEGLVITHKVEGKVRPLYGKSETSLLDWIR